LQRNLVGAGVIDRDYTGEVKVLLFNLGTDELVFHAGDRIAQLIVKHIDKPDIEEVESLEDTERGAGGFGSTGM
jgi:dUTP pyrophosphatase